MNRFLTLSKLYMVILLIDGRENLDKATMVYAHFSNIIITNIISILDSK